MDFRTTRTVHYVANLKCDRTWSTEESCVFVRKRRDVRDVNGKDPVS